MVARKTYHVPRGGTEGEVRERQVARLYWDVRLLYGPNHRYNIIVLLYLWS